MNAANRRNERFAGLSAMAATLVLWGAGLSAAAPQAAPALLEGAEAEAFLRAAPIVGRKPIGKGITRSEKLTLSDGMRTARAAFKTIHERVMGLSRWPTAASSSTSATRGSTTWPPTSSTSCSASVSCPPRSSAGSTAGAARCSSGSREP